MKLGRTQQGFAYAEFLDDNGRECSIQKSSIATDDRIWLGLDGDRDGSLGAMRMHLSRANAAELWPLLKRFAETGELTGEER